MWYVLLTLIISSSWAGSAFYRPSAAEYAETKAIALRLMREFPEDTHHIVAIGRSPSVLAAWLFNLKASNFSTLPLSNMNNFAQVDDPQKHQKAITHLDFFLSSRFDKKLVFFDFTYGGKSYLAQKELLEEYLRTRHPETKYEFVALVGENQTALIEKLKQSHVKPWTLSLKSTPPYGSLLWDALFHSEYEDFAEFKSFVLWRDQKPQTNSHFDEFKRLVMKVMNQDPTIRCRIF